MRVESLVSMTDGLAGQGKSLEIYTQREVAMGMSAHRQPSICRRERSRERLPLTTT